MVFRKASDKFVAAATATAFLLGFGSTGSAQETSKQIVEPVFRVSRLAQPNEDEKPVEVARNTTPAKSANESKAILPIGTNAVPANAASSSTRVPQPLDNAIEIAHNGLSSMKANIHDYTAILVKRETVDGVLGEANYMRIKIRNDRTNEQGSVPFSVYMKFLKPKSVSGREVIWVEGQNENKIMAHETGLITGMKTFHLDPDGWLAMQGNRHPIYEAGLENLVEKLIEKAERDRAAGECTVDYRTGAKINGRVCTMIEVVHDTKRDPYEFYKAQVFIDDEHQVPVRYCAWDWPTSPGADPQIQEEYTYIQIETNVGLTDKDFDPMNSEYSFPGR